MRLPRTRSRVLAKAHEESKAHTLETGVHSQSSTPSKQGASEHRPSANSRIRLWFDLGSIVNQQPAFFDIIH